METDELGYIPRNITDIKFAKSRKEKLSIFKEWLFSGEIDEISVKEIITEYEKEMPF